MKTKYVLLFIVLLTIGCETGIHVCTMKPGIYELRSETIPNAQIYRFDSTAKDNILFCGTNGVSLEFTDLITNKRIILKEDNMCYRGRLISPKEIKIEN